MRITKVYTRTGDRGLTRLVGGQQVDKDDARIEAYGTVDELNAILGLARDANQRSAAAPAVVEELDGVLHRIQNHLFHVGADLATQAADRWPTMVRVGDAEIGWLEQTIDRHNAQLEPLVEFILPGGGPVSAQLHQARTVCRRAERRLVTLLRADPSVEEGCLRYLNRLSDLLFVTGRWACKQHGETELLWDNPKHAK